MFISHFRFGLKHLLELLIRIPQCLILIREGNDPISQSDQLKIELMVCNFIHKPHCIS